MIIVLESNLWINNLKDLDVCVCVCVLEEEIAGSDLHEPIWPHPSFLCSICFIYPLLVDLVMYSLT